MKKKFKYKILHTEAKYAIDGKDHYSILVDRGNKDIMGNKLWERAINKSFETEEEANIILCKIREN